MTLWLSYLTYLRLSFLIRKVRTGIVLSSRVGARIICAIGRCLVHEIVSIWREESIANTDHALLCPHSSPSASTNFVSASQLSAANTCNSLRRAFFTYCHLLSQSSCKARCLQGLSPWLPRITFYWLTAICGYKLWLQVKLGEQFTQRHCVLHVRRGTESHLSTRVTSLMTFFLYVYHFLILLLGYLVSLPK